MFEPEIKHIEAENVAFIEMRGPYSQIPESYGRLYGWVEARGFKPAPDKMPAAVYLTMPEETSEENALWELWAPLHGGPPDLPVDEVGIGIKRVEATRVVSLMHKGPYDTVGPSYEKVVAFIANEGLAVSGPPMELYYSDPNNTAPEDYLTEIRFPIGDA
ncbi:MAG: GyrI-like domain-containing protein [Actinomycetota bacterium]|nr:GyrI-like domain-containing protein [Actinomycetota bacterium]